MCPNPQFLGIGYSNILLCFNKLCQSLPSFSSSIASIYGAALVIISKFLAFICVLVPPLLLFSISLISLDMMSVSKSRVRLSLEYILTLKKAWVCVRVKVNAISQSLFSFRLDMYYRNRIYFLSLTTCVCILQPGYVSICLYSYVCPNPQFVTYCNVLLYFKFKLCQPLPSHSSPIALILCAEPLYLFFCSRHMCAPPPLLFLLTWPGYLSHHICPPTPSFFQLATVIDCFALSSSSFSPFPLPFLPLPSQVLSHPDISSSFAYICVLPHLFSIRTQPGYVILHMRGSTHTFQQLATAIYCFVSSSSSFSPSPLPPFFSQPSYVLSDPYNPSLFSPHKCTFTIFPILTQPGYVNLHICGSTPSFQ